MKLIKCFVIFLLFLISAQAQEKTEKKGTTVDVDLRHFFPQPTPQVPTVEQGDVLDKPVLSWGVEQENEVYLYDLYRSNLHVDPPTPPDFKAPDPLHAQENRFYAVLEKKLSSTINLQTIRILANKLEEIDSIYSPFAVHLYNIIIVTFWRITEEVEANVSQKVLISKRDSRSVYLTRSFWERCDARNQAALIFRNALSSASTPDVIADRRNPAKSVGFRLNNTQIQETVAYLFSRELYFGGFPALHQISYNFFGLGHNKTLWPRSPVKSRDHHWLMSLGRVKLQMIKTDESVEETIENIDSSDFGDLQDFLSGTSEHIVIGRMCDKAYYNKTQHTAAAIFTIPLTVHKLAGISFYRWVSEIYDGDLPLNALNQVTQSDYKTEKKVMTDFYPEQKFSIRVKTVPLCESAVRAKLKVLRERIIKDLKYPQLYSL